jgi:hypothetical protein
MDRKEEGRELELYRKLEAETRLKGMHNVVVLNPGRGRGNSGRQTEEAIDMFINIETLSGCSPQYLNLES